MNVKKSLRLSVTNWQLTIKVICTQLFTISAFVGIAAVFMTGTINNVIKAIQQTSVLENFQNLILHFNLEQFDTEEFIGQLSVFVNSVSEALSLVPNFYKQVVFAGIFIILGVFVTKLVSGFCDLALISSLNEFMLTSSNRPYFWWYSHNIVKSLLFQLLYLSLTFFWDFFNIIGVVAMYLFILSSLGGMGVAIAVAIYLLLTSLRLTIFAFWLPSYANENRQLTHALADALKTIVDRFVWIFLQTLVISVVYGTLLVCIILYLNSIWIFVVAIAVGLYAFYMLKCMNIVEYYEAKGKAYFVKPIKLNYEDINK